MSCREKIIKFLGPKDSKKFLKMIDKVCSIGLEQFVINVSENPSINPLTTRFISPDGEVYKIVRKIVEFANIQSGKKTSITRPDPKGLVPLGPVPVHVPEGNINEKQLDQIVEKMQSKIVDATVKAIRGIMNSRDQNQNPPNNPNQQSVHPPSKQTIKLPVSLEGRRIAFMDFSDESLEKRIKREKGIFVKDTRCDLMIYEKLESTQIKVTTGTLLKKTDFISEYFPPVPSCAKNLGLDGKNIAFQCGYRSPLIQKYLTTCGGTIVPYNFGSIDIYITDPKQKPNLTGESLVFSESEFLAEFMIQCMSDTTARLKTLRDKNVPRLVLFAGFEDDVLKQQILMCGGAVLDLVNDRQKTPYYIVYKEKEELEDVLLQFHIKKGGSTLILYDDFIQVMITPTRNESIDHIRKAGKKTIVEKAFL